MQNKHLQVANKLNADTAKTRKFTLTRMDYVTSLIERHPEAEVFTNEELKVVAYRYTVTRSGNRSNPALMLFIGRANKPAIHTAYWNEEAREKALESVINGLKSREEQKQKRKVERSLPHTLVVGDILDCHWGYDQTNIDYYQVTKLIGKTMVEVRPIGKEVTGSAGCQQYVVPKKNAFFTPRHEGDTYKTKATRHRVDGDSIRINSFSHASKWNGKVNAETHPMYGR